jgi:hypothetical protein
MSPIVSLQSASAGLATGSPAEIIIGTKTSGPTGIESVLEYRGMLLNFRDWIDTYRVDSIDGLGDADIRDARENNPAAHGETAFQPYYGGRTIVLSGKIRAHTVWKLRDMVQSLRQTFADISQESPLIFHTPDPASDLMIYCKKNAPINIPESQQNFQMERDFQITLRASNPRFVSFVEQYRHQQVDAGSASWTITNNGNFQAEPRIRFIGPMNANSQVINNINGTMLKLRSAIPNLSTYELDIANRTFVDLTPGSVGVNRFSALDISSTWLQLEPGDNHIDFTGTGTGGNSAIDMYWRHSYL